MDYLQAYKTMFYALEDYYFKTNNDTLGGMLGFMSPELFFGEKPIDAAVLKDWEASIKKVTNSNHLSLENCIQATIEFLEFYLNEFGYDVQWIINDLQEEFAYSDKWADYSKRAISGSSEQQQSY